MTKAEIRKARQAEHEAREAARATAGDTRTARERHSDEMQERARARRRGRRARPGSLEWAESRGGLIGGYETDETYCPD
jgi:hypothetical protein